MRLHLRIFMMLNQGCDKRWPHLIKLQQVFLVCLITPVASHLLLDIRWPPFLFCVAVCFLFQIQVLRLCKDLRLAEEVLVDAVRTWRSHKTMINNYDAYWYSEGSLFTIKSNRWCTGKLLGEWWGVPVHVGPQLLQVFQPYNQFDLFSFDNQYCCWFGI